MENMGSIALTLAVITYAGVPWAGSPVLPLTEQA